MKFTNEDEILRFFERGGCMVDTVLGHVYKGDVNYDGEFFGVFMYEPVPEEARHDLDLALEYADAWDEYDVPGCWFETLARNVLHFPDHFICEKED